MSSRGGPFAPRDPGDGPDFFCGVNMSYDELMARGKMIFNFHPDQPFESVGHLLDIARRNRRRDFYEQAAAVYAEALAKFADEHASV